MSANEFAEYIAVQRAEAFQHIQKILEDRIEFCFLKRCSEREAYCLVVKSLMDSFMKKLIDEKLFHGCSRLQRSLEQLALDLKQFKFEFPSTFSGYGYDGCSQKCDEIVFEARNLLNLTAESDYLYNAIHPPCFDCVQDSEKRPIQACTHKLK